jgi:shikimate 5-dehydrogenase
MNIDGHTILTGLLGSPVSHSISPSMHNESFRMLDLNYIYLCFDVNTDNLKIAVEGMKALGVKGFNCTYPDKNLMCSLADRLSPAAEMIGAVNTVLNENGVLTGFNTDGMGYMLSLKDGGFDIIGKKMTLLGAGGAATSIAVQAALDGVAQIDMFSRRTKFWNRALELADVLNRRTSCHVCIYDMADTTQLKQSLKDSKILTNGTSVGMAPDTEGCLITDMSMFHEELIVSDIVYNPRETKLLKLAKEHDCKTFHGLYMLLYQGAEAFKIWTGKEMPVLSIKEKFFS